MFVSLGFRVLVSVFWDIYLGFGLLCLFGCVFFSVIVLGQARLTIPYSGYEEVFRPWVGVDDLR